MNSQLMAFRDREEPITPKKGRLTRKEMRQIYDIVSDPSGLGRYPFPEIHAILAPYFEKETE